MLALKKIVTDDNVYLRVNNRHTYKICSYYWEIIKLFADPDFEYPEKHTHGSTSGSMWDSITPKTKWKKYFDTDCKLGSLLIFLGKCHMNDGRVIINHRCNYIVIDDIRCNDDVGKMLKKLIETHTQFIVPMDTMFSATFSSFRSDHLYLEEWERPNEYKLHVTLTPEVVIDTILSDNFMKFLSRATIPNGYPLVKYMMGDKKSPYPKN